MTNGASRSRLREYNARTVIHALRRGGPASQSEIAERAGLSVPAVSAIMWSLTEAGCIREVRSDNPGRGRPRVIVDVVPEAAYSLGIHIDPSLITAVLLDLRGNVVEVNHSPEVDPSDPTRTLRVAAGMARAVTPDGSRGDRVVGAGLALSLSELANEAVRSGLDFLCATDHNTISHHAHLRGLGAAHGITLVPGQEVTTHRGHANAFGDIGFIDFREDVDHWARTVAERGGLLSVNHPVSGDCSWLHEVPPGAAGVEILHSDLYQQPISMAALAWLELARGGSENDPGTVLLGGGDFHRTGEGIRPGTPTTWVCATDNSVTSILAAMTTGRTAVTNSTIATTEGGEAVLRPNLVDAPIVLRTDDAAVQVIDAEGLVLVDSAGRRRVIESAHDDVDAPLDAGPVHLETRDRAMVAICR